MEAATPDLVAFAPSKKPARHQKRRILAATTLKALTPPPRGGVDYFDDLTPGFSLRVTASLGGLSLARRISAIVDGTLCFPGALACLRIRTAIVL